MNGRRARYKVAVLKTIPATTRAVVREALEAIGAEIAESDGTSEEEFLKVARDADAVVGVGVRLTSGIIRSLENCKIIAVGGVGTDHVDVAAATAQGIVVTNVPDMFIEEVADHTMTLLLACWRRLTLQDRSVRANRWRDGQPMLAQIPRLRGQTLGFIGFGNIARTVTRRAKPFGLHIIAQDPYISELVMNEADVEPVAELSELLGRADFVSIHVPASPATRHMLTEERFQQMKRTAVFLNTARGELVDEHALIKALREEWIAFAGLDVFDKEPLDPDNPLLLMDNVILTAHVASVSSRIRPRVRRLAQEISQVLQGRRPLSPVNPQVLSKPGL